MRHWTSLLRETAGLAASAMVGACVGAILPLKAEALVASVVTCAVLGAIVWKRRRSDVGATVGICFVVVVVLGPVAFVALDWLHQYY